MTNTLAELDAAIQRYVAENFPGALTGAWMVVTHSQSLEDGRDGISNYRIITPESQPLHIDWGLARVGERIVKDSWDNDSYEEDDD